jgi:predicted DNA-binding transcriptional regulator AlpA
MDNSWIFATIPASRSCPRRRPAKKPKRTVVRDRDQQRVEPRGLSRVEVAAYIGVSPSMFDIMVKDGRMPQPKRINSRTVWDRRAVDIAFEELPDSTERNPWDDEAAA